MSRPSPVVPFRGAALGPAEIRQRFGRELEFERSAGGRTQAIRGAPGRGELAPGGYDPRDVAQVLRRAREVLEGVGHELGLDSLELSAISAETRTGEVSAQVRFAQSHGGLRLEPAGGVHVDLGARGEVLNVSADVVRDLHVVNQRRLTSEEAQGKAVAALSEVSEGIGSSGGSPVIWVETPQRQAAPIGRHAYGYSIEGRKVVVDAESGAILYQRDRRQF